MATRKTHLRAEAVAFRIRGFTYLEIGKLLGVSRSTVCQWLKHDPVSIKVAHETRQQAVRRNTDRLRLINKAKETSKQRELARVREAARLEYRHYRSHPGFMAGIAVYVALGDLVSPGTIRLSTHRKEAQRLFHAFLANYLGVTREKIHVWLLLHPHHDESTCQRYWQDQLHLSEGQFYAHQRRPSTSERATLQFGVPNTIIADTLAKKKLLTWVELVQADNEIISGHG